MKQLIMIIILDTNHKATDKKKKKRYSQLPGGLSCLGDLWGSLHHEEVMTGPQLDRAVYKLQMGLNICLLEGINRVE